MATLFNHTILMNLFIGTMYVKIDFMNMHNMSTPVLWATLVFFLLQFAFSCKNNQKKNKVKRKNCTINKGFNLFKVYLFWCPLAWKFWLPYELLSMVLLNLRTPFDGDHRAHIPSYTIFVNALGRSHHPPVRFEGFANDQYFIGCHVTSWFVASALPLS